MIYQIKIQFKKYIKQILHVLISFQLCFMPYYSFAAVSKNGVVQTQEGTSINNVLAEFQGELEKDNPKLAKTITKINELATAIESGQIEDHLKSNKYTAQDKDYFLLSGQVAKAISYHVSSQNNKHEVVESVDSVADLNRYSHQPINRVFQTIHVKYDKKLKTIILEGISEKKVQLRQTIPNLDIVDYAYDQEILILLDKNKGLLLVDMFFAREYLGNAPIPISRITDSILPQLKKLGDNVLTTNKKSLTLEFINRGVSPPDHIPDSIKNINKNFDKKNMFEAGDFMISHVDNNNQKNLVRFIKRSELYGWIKLHYRILNIMTKVIAPQLMDANEIKEFSNTMKKEKQQNPELILNNLVSSLFTKPALAKLIHTAEGIKLREEQLNNPNLRDKMLLTEWRESFNIITARLQSKQVEPEKSKINKIVNKAALLFQLKKREEQQKPKTNEDNKIEGNIPDTNELAKLHIDPKRKKKKEILSAVLSIMANAKNFANTHRVSVGATVTIGGTALLMPLQYLEIASIYISLLSKSISSADLVLHADASMVNFIFLGLMLPAAVFSLSALSIPFVKFMSKHTPYDLSIGKKVYHPKGKLLDFLDKWGNTDITQRIVGAGMRIVSYAIYPLWNYIGSIVGQPHFISAIQKGLNPFQKIDLNSDLGKLLKLKKDTRLGSQGFVPQWNTTNKAYKKHEKLQNTASTKEQKMHSIAWLMASLAVSERTGVSPQELMIYGASINLDKLKAVFNDDTLRSDMLWVQKHLLKEIRILDELDIQKQMAEIDSKMILKYYKSALALAHKVKQHSPLRIKIRKMFNTKAIYTLKQRLKLSSIANFNKTQHEILQQVPSSFVEERIFVNTMIDHFLVTIIPLVVTDRANIAFEDNHVLSMHSNNSLWTDKPHFTEIWQNIISHLLISGAILTLTFKNISNSLNILNDKQYKKYQPASFHTHETKGKVQTEGSLYKNFFQTVVTTGSPSSFGSVFVVSNLKRLRNLQMGFLLMMATRLTLTNQVFEEALLGYLLMMFAADWVFNWPWYLLISGGKNNDNYLNKNIEITENLKIKFSNISKGVYSDKKTMIKEYKEAVAELKELYHKAALKKNISKLDTEFSTEDLTVEKIQKTSQKILEVLATVPALPNQKNKLADITMTFIFGGIITNILFVALSIATFNPDYLNWSTVGMVGAFNIALLSMIHVVYKKSLKDRVNDILRYNKYFYNKGKSTINFCAGAFKPKKA